MTSSKIYIIVPAFNEAPVLEQTLTSLSACGYPIMLVDDGSTDQTENIAAKFPLLYIKHRLNIGQGAALSTGMLAAAWLQADIVVHFDADGQHDVNEIPQLIEPLLQNKCDIIFGSRFLRREGGKNIPFFRKLMLRTARYVHWLLYGILLSDAHNGFRAMNRKAYELMIFSQHRMGHASEILQLAGKNKLRFREMPVTIRYSPYTMKKGQSIFNSVTILFDLIFKKII